MDTFEKLRDTIEYNWNQFDQNSELGRRAIQNMRKRINHCLIDQDSKNTLYSSLDSVIIRATENGKKEHQKWQQQYDESEMDKKNEAIQQLRNNWKSKNILWKVFNRKYNPNKANFDSMTADQIEYSAIGMKLR